MGADRSPRGTWTQHGRPRPLRLLEPRIAIPIHWGTLAPLYRRTPYDPDAVRAFAALARLAAPEVDVRVLRVGETISLETEA